MQMGAFQAKEEGLPSCVHRSLLNANTWSHLKPLSFDLFMKVMSLLIYTAVSF